jgi:hypothetical protein
MNPVSLFGAKKLMLQKQPFTSLFNRRVPIMNTFLKSKYLAVALFALLLTTFLAGCDGGSKLDGTYVGAPHAHFEKLTFKSEGKVELTFMGSTSEATYVVEGDKVKISAAGQTQIFTVDKQGCLDGGGIVGKYCKQ